VTSAETLPATINSTTGLTTTGQINVEISTVSTPTPTSYSCRIYSNSGLTTLVASGSCVSTGYTTYSTGLASGTTVYITATANPATTAYASSTSGTTTGPVH
jgi:hypothetical protein